MTDVKICGLKTVDALDAALEGGADYVGLVFFAASPRNVTLQQAAALAGHARGRAQIVALVVDADDAALAAILEDVAPDWLQLHGRESPERVREIKQRTGLPVIKAIPVATQADATRAYDYAGIADLVLFDAKAPQGAVLPGGNGHAFDWSALDGVKERMPFMLSGGLTADNVQDALRATNAGAVDVSSGVESAPGVKDPELIQRFLEAVKGSIEGA
jgi:phosphoribosylanthranilate isomerase